MWWLGSEGAARLYIFPVHMDLPLSCAELDTDLVTKDRSLFRLDFCPTSSLYCFTLGYQLQEFLLPRHHRRNKIPPGTIVIQDYGSRTLWVPCHLCSIRDQVLRTLLVCDRKATLAPTGLSTLKDTGHNGSLSAPAFLTFQLSGQIERVCGVGTSWW